MPVFLLGTVVNVSVLFTLLRLVGPPFLDKSYGKTIGPSVVP